jgi:hypothetical protein
MSKQEDRDRKIAQWLEHLQGWKVSGQSVSAYARERGVTLWAMYHWRGVLIREGLWQAQPMESGHKSAVPLTFARVAVTDATRSAPLIVRVVLGNGRRAEIELSELSQLGKILSALEVSA